MRRRQEIRCEAVEARGGVKDWRAASRVEGSKIFVFLILTLTMIPRGEARGSGIPDVRRLIDAPERLHGKQGDETRYANGIGDEWSQEILYIGRSGDPWASSEVRNEKEHVAPSPANHTYNETGGEILDRATYGSGGPGRVRFKRGVVHLYNMVVCATGCNPLAYKGYGCYCGFLGSGYVIDGIDRCCKMHDWCYDATECPMYLEYFVPYYWRCYHGYKPVCAVEHGDWGGSGSCAQRLCECDRSLAECLRRFPCPTTKAVCTSSPWRLVQNLFMIM